VLAFLKADANISQVLAAGGKLDDTSVKLFTWNDARNAIAKDFGAGTNLDVVLSNFTQANMLQRDIMENFAFARVKVALPGNNGDYPLTVVLKKDGAAWKPTRVADGGIPFDS
jgi:hypothetical protein